VPDPEAIDPNSDTLEWHCLRTQTKREHIAASILGQREGVEVFCPRISQVKKTRTGKKRFVEAMFPGYIFARFNYRTRFREIKHSQGVSRIVELGGRRVIPSAVIEDLQASVPDGFIEAPDPSIETGAEIEVITGSLQGLNGQVIATLPAKNRIQVLLEFLGREITVDVQPDDILLARERDQ